MKKFSRACLGMLLAAVAVPQAAFAQDAEAEDTSGITITGGATLVSDYRFRGFSQNSEEATIQGTFTVAHDSGLYVGAWGSGISFAGGSEIDIYGGYATQLGGGVGIDVGATLYWYPGSNGADNTLIEPYVALTADVGPVSGKLGVAYAPDQDFLGSESAIYTYLDLKTAIPNTPLTLKGHIGYAKSDSFPGGFDGEVFDYMVGVDVTYKVLTFNVSYVNTDETNALGFKEAIGADGAVLFSIGAAF